MMALTWRWMAVSLAVLLLFACSDGNDDTTTDGDMDGGDPIEQEQEEEDPGPGDFTLTQIGVMENPQNVLSVTVEFTSSVETRAAILVEGPDGEAWTVGPTKKAAKTHSMRVLGLVAETDYSFTIRATDQDGRYVLSEPQSYTTGSLPVDFPPMNVTVSKPDSMEPGYTLFNVYRWTTDANRDWGLIVAVDAKGRVVWYHRGNTLVFDARWLGDGRIIFNSLELYITEVNTYNEEQKPLSAWTLGLDTIHHDITPLPSGHWLTLSTEMKEISGYPAEGGGTTSYNVVGDLIVELGADLKPIKDARWSMFDLIDPLRVKPGFDDIFWNAHYIKVDSTRDWTHANAVEYFETDDSMLISLRHQDWLLMISHATGGLLWKLGPEGDFTLESGDWFYHQHAPEFDREKGTLLLYDNGNFRPTLQSGQSPYSRAVEYAVDEAKRTLRQTWEYKNDTPYFSSFAGDANRLANGNVLICDGGIISDPSLDHTDPLNHKSLRIVEVTGGETSEKVFELVIDDTAATGAKGYSGHRVTRIKSLYPEEY